MSERAEPIHRADPHDSAVHAKLNWLRAGVLGANDGIVSVAALVVGVAAATTDVAAILIAGVAAVVAGAISMGLGEYVSVSSQRDTERALIAKERHELDTMPEQELAELAGLYRAKGLSAATAETVARELTAHDALAAHLEVELHIDEDDVVNPWHAAGASALSFLVGRGAPDARHPAAAARVADHRDVHRRGRRARDHRLAQRVDRRQPEAAGGAAGDHRRGARPRRHLGDRSHARRGRVTCRGSRRRGSASRGGCTRTGGASSTRRACARRTSSSSRHAALTSIEVNGSFYALQRPANWVRWRDAVPDDFVFAVKGPRFITHIKRLGDIDAPLANFLASGVLALGEKLGPLLWQLPPNLAFDEALLDAFLARLPRTHGAAAALARHRDERMSGRSSYALRAAPDRPLEHAVEVRHPSFEQHETAWVSLLERHHVASVAADTAGRYPRIDRTTADFAYARLHGDRELYVSGLRRRRPRPVGDVGARSPRRRPLRVRVLRQRREGAGAVRRDGAHRPAGALSDSDGAVAAQLVVGLPLSVRRSPCRHGATIGRWPRSMRPVVPKLTDAQWDRLVSHGVAVDVAVGDMLFRTGDRWYDLILVESGAVEVVRDALPWVGETSIVTLGPRTFVGELGLLNGQRAFLSARATEAGRMYRVDHAALQRLMAEDDELCDLLLRTLWARRDFLRRGPAALSLKIVGTQRSAGATALRRYAERLELAHTWVDADDPETAAHIFEHGFSRDDLPVAIVQGENVRNATPGQVAELLGLAYVNDDDTAADLAVVGGGPAGLAAAIYGASEGLRTVLLDSIAPGGQSAATSRIENYLGFPFGVSGDALTGQASLQAFKFGVRVFAPCEVAGLQASGDPLTLTLADGRLVQAGRS